ncbi:MAG TPA: ParB/RepB/Spo0J family partition protein [Planctomycetota bacterium]|jgi:hypothetical protein
MKVSVSELQPNPFRDLAHYPFHRGKIEALKASIRATGFWDNVLARKSDDGKHYQVAYGHHRLEALKELVREKILDEGYEVDVPVRKLDDGAMIRIMAGENMEEYRVSAEVIDETVRVAREFLSKETKTPMTELTPTDISQFLGSGWNEDKVGLSLQRLGLFDRGTLKREQLKGLTQSASRTVQREVAKVERVLSDTELSRMGDEEVTEQDRKRVRAQVQKVASHVAEVLAKHIRNGGSSAESRQKSLDAQVEMIPENATSEQKQLSTIDTAVHAISARDFQRKVEMLQQYREYMSPDAKDELEAKIKELAGWCRQMLENMKE